MKKPILPSNESERLRVLKGYSIMDSLPEKEYDAIAQLAAYICETPMAFISFLDEKREWLKAKIGLEVRAISRDISFSQYTIMGDELFEVSNASDNEIFAGTPWVTSDPNILFYAGVPIRDQEGSNLGALCVMDTKAGNLTKEQENALKLLATQVVSLLNLRKNNINLITAQNEFENFQNLSTDLVIIANVNGLFYKVNPAFIQLLGYAREEMEGKPFLDFIHPDDVDKTYREVEKLTRGELSLSFENRYRTTKGDYVLLSWKAFLDTETGNLYCIARDVTLAKKQEEEQIYATNELKAILNSSEFSIIATELDGTIKQFNKGAEVLLGYKAEEVVGKFAPTIIHVREELVKRSEQLSKEFGEKITPGFETLVINNRKSGIADSKQWTYVRKDGTVFPVILSVTSIKNNMGEITGYLGIAKDITKEKVAELNLINNNKLLDESQSIAKTGSWKYDLLTKEVVWSQGHYKIFEMEELPADQLFDAYRSRVHPDDVSILNTLFEKMIKTGEGFTYEHRIVFPDGRIKYILGIWQSVKNGKGKITGAQGTIQDITAKTLDEQKILEKTKEIRDIRLALDESVIVSIVDRNGLFTFVNDNFCTISKYSKEELIGMDQRMISGFLSKEFTRDILNTITSGNIWKGEIRNRAKDGSYYWENTTIVPFLNKEKQPYQYVNLSNDITHQKSIEEELINARNLAEQSAIAKEQFLTNMSHEIRTPMNGILGFARILDDSKLDEEQKQNVDAIKRAGENLMVIINDILDFSKIEADKMTFEEVNFSLSKTVNAVFELFGPKAKENKIELFYEIDSVVNDILMGDPTRLSQILINLVGNALKFTLEGSVKLIISKVNDTESDIVVQFSVIDTGIGIPKNKIESVFESFNQASNETTRKYGGTGLGLSITRRLIELQGGNITVKSEVPKGSEFTFFIQYRKAKKGTLVLEKKQTKQLTPDFLKSIKILLVEDNDLNQLLAIKIFKKWGSVIDIADNGKMAIEKIENNHYDIVLMDIQLPEMDGYEMTRYIRKNMGAKSNIPIIALTAHATIGEEQKCLDLGMNDYLSKPFDSYKLLKKLHQNLNESPVIIPSSLPKKEISSNSLVDFIYLRDFAEGDTGFMEEMISLFLNNTPATLATLLELNKNNDIINLKAEIHKLRSSFGLLGIEKAITSAGIIEKEIETNPLGHKRIKEVENLVKICNRAMIELKRLKKHL